MRSQKFIWAIYFLLTVFAGTVYGKTGKFSSQARSRKPASPSKKVTKTKGKAEASSVASVANFPSQMAKVVAGETQVYQNADFDAPVIAIVRAGQSFEISKVTFGPFYKIKISPTTIGFVSDIDVRPTGAKNAQSGGRSVASQDEPGRDGKKKSKKGLMESSRYRGLGFQMAQYTENTMGKVRNENLFFYGIKISGNNTFIEGDIYVDSNLLFHYGAPTYYQSLTQRVATGWIVLGEMIFEAPLLSGKDYIGFLGFGPLVKYSHFDVSLKNSDTDRIDNFSMDDIAGGVVLNLGLALRLSSQLSIRAEGKYYIEQSRYSAGLFGLQWEY